MASNLRVTTYNNGNTIPEISASSTWPPAAATGVRTVYNDLTINLTNYGYLYNWYAVNDTRGLCPSGWHVPSDGEWSTLINYLDPSANGGDTWPNVAGGKLKSTTGWNYGNEGATNESGFTGLPGGYRTNYGTYLVIGSYGYWWSSTENVSGLAWFRLLDYNVSYVGRSSFNKQFGFSVRCVRD